MLRYVVSFPASLSQSSMEAIRDQLNEAVGHPQFRDVVLTQGGTITDLRRQAASVRRREPRVPRFVNVEPVE